MKTNNKKNDKRFKKHKVVICHFCKKEMVVAEELDDIEYVVTKSGDVIYFHNKCFYEDVRNGQS
ncbi:MAG: hypothetical protein R3Y58_03470 [Eubacteriales bacterium]